MCLAVPMKVTVLRDDQTGIADLDGVAHEVDLSLISNPQVGDYVIIHAGLAIERLKKQEAEELLAFIRQLAAEAPAQ